MNLELLNPWWKGKNAIGEDKHLKEYEKRGYKWVPPLLEEIDLKPGNIHTLRGPRQVGKTTLVKILVRKLLEKVPEKAVFYWNCDEVADFKELAERLREYLSFSERYGVKERYIFLDEVSRVREWQRAVKSMVDSGELEGTCLLLTGSHTLDIKYGGDLLPGRRGKANKDYVLLPMTFREFVGLVAPGTGARLPSCKPGIKSIVAAAGKAKAFDAELSKLFDVYLITGGFPLVVNEFLENREIPEYVYDLYFRWVVGDIVKWGKQERILGQIMGAVLNKQASAISWDSLAKEAEVKSHKTISSYVEALDGMFVLVVLYFLERAKGIADANKNKKLYFLDPFIFHVFNRKLNFKDAEVTPALIEAVVVSHIHRLGETFYWKEKKEVDVVLIRDGVLPIEVKYQKSISKSDRASLYPFGKGILATKNVFTADEKYPAVPVHLLLAVLDTDV